MKTLKALKNRTGRGFLALTAVKPYPAYYVTEINRVENEMSKRVSLLRFHRAQESYLTALLPKFIAQIDLVDSKQ